jgi:hypothetical protein
VQANAEVGDQICALFGTGVPFVLRPKDGDFTFFGACLLHGIMDGEAEVLQRGDRPAKNLYQAATMPREKMRQACYRKYADWRMA